MTRLYNTENLRNIYISTIRINIELNKTIEYKQVQYTENLLLLPKIEKLN